ncbi:amidohydrolase family protein [Microvenator marinus]|uniref:Amidohydrolase family protein n=1 Tax=Microvenator marinus TaxID=2600177 RepID=A0A5B8XNR2_9DELT|nr:amidohydrolase family protein [Microvenator marinus]QED26787.1 amidohydrolase family protein [Microvenator marinus]
MILVKDGLVFDGTGEPGFRTNIIIKAGRIHEFADEVDEAQFDKVIDAKGCWVMPGFLDTHTHYDAEILAGPGLHESVRHGVTTVCIGSCSLSTILSPPEDCADFFTRVEALPREHVLPALEKYKTWTSPKEYIEGLESRPLGPNVACFLGHSDMRCAAMGLGRSVDASVRPSKEELAQMEAWLNEALDAGYLGMSTMTNPWDKVGGERFTSSKLPSTYATWAEYRHFHKILRKRGRILQSAPNITTKYNVFAFLAETASFWVRRPLKVTLISAADTKADPWLSTLVTTTTGWWNKLLGADLKWQTVPMPFEVYADGMDLVVFEEFGAGEAALHLADELERNELLKDEDYRREFRRDYEKRWSPRVWHRDFYDATIVECPDETWVGKTFGEVADEQKLHPVDAFLDLVVEHGTKLRWKTTIANHRSEKLVKLASDKSVHVSFSDAGAHVRNMAFYNFALYYLKSVWDAERAKTPVIPIEKAIRKVTGELADWYQIDAGYICPDDRADLVIVNPDGLDDSLGGYHEAPMEMMGGLERMVRRNDDAVVATLISGHVVYERGQFSEDLGAKRLGSFLRVGEPSP